MAEARSIHSFFLTAPNQHRPFCDLAGRTAQPCPSPALCALFPHPLQNRVPRGERAPVALPRRSRLPPWSVLGAPHRGAAPEPTGKTSPSASATKPAKTLGFRRFSCVAWLCGSRWFGHWVFSSGCTRPQPFSSPPAPKTHPVSPFSG